MSRSEVDERTTAVRGGANEPRLARLAAERALAARFDDPANVVALAKVHSLDRLGIGLRGATLPCNRPLASPAYRCLDWIKVSASGWVAHE